MDQRSLGLTVDDSKQAGVLDRAEVCVELPGLAHGVGCIVVLGPLHVVHGVGEHRHELAVVCAQHRAGYVVGVAVAQRDGVDVVAGDAGRGLEEGADVAARGGVGRVDVAERGVHQHVLP